MTSSIAKQKKNETPKKINTSKATLLACPPEDFINQFFSNLLPDDLASLSESERKKLAASMWQLAQKREKGTISLRIFNPDMEKDGWTVDHTVLETINDDMPFLLDSVVNAIQNYGLTVHLSIHPVICASRDARGYLQTIDRQKCEAESMMHIHFDRCLDPQTIESLAKDVRLILQDVRASVEDWNAMQQASQAIMEEIGLTEGTVPHTDTQESKNFLAWLNDKNFTFLGYQKMDLSKYSASPKWKTIPDSGLGILRDEKPELFGDLLDGGAQTKDLLPLTQKGNPITILKTNTKSRVHRNVPMDAIMVQRYDEKRNIVGHHLIVGLFTAKVYAQSAIEIPLIQHKIAEVVRRAHFDPLGHNGRSLMHILDSYPRDELFQIDTDTLFEHTLGIVQLQDRARVALFMRRDILGRFLSCLVYVPKDRHDASVSTQIQNYLETKLSGTITNQNIRIGDSALAQLFITISVAPSTKIAPKHQMESDLRELCRAWTDKLRDRLLSLHGEAETLRLLKKYASAFPAAYRALNSEVEATKDIDSLEQFDPSQNINVHLERKGEDGLLTLKLFSQTTLALSNILPILENMGLNIHYTDGPFEMSPKTDQAKNQIIYLHSFVCKASKKIFGEFKTVQPIFEQALVLLLKAEAENDSLNSLTLFAGLPSRDIFLLRTLAKYMHQIRLPYTQESIAATLNAHPLITRDLVQLFLTRHDPDGKGDRPKEEKNISNRLKAALNAVSVLEEDRIINHMHNIMSASLRSNYFQKLPNGNPKPYLAIKIDSRAIDDMPLPKPLLEIFVSSPRVDAIHLRGGKVARGGIRWSDRRDDYRSEILGLMKAQMVKNSVIVPVGSKGGFIVKHPPEGGHTHLQEEAIACYRIMMSGLLDLTDNRVGSKIVSPARVVRHDGDDPYLVVAADKGTATFSDIANGLSQDYNFWLDDAFASGGSVGYDHKQMGITARGVWESVKRHFRELGQDTQSEDFSCIGIGDMSGDVFGNGMLLSKHICLIGAFDHRHIFCDPTPHALSSYEERKRLFGLPRSTWADYDKKKLSKGGAIFSRAEKILHLTPEIKKAYGIDDDTVTPAHLIKAMLKASVDLLYFGGIGTYIKAANETNADVKDRANDSIRVDAHDVHARVIAEGANLGVTQRGRIVFAQKGGRINTDAIDNSAGVSTSDHEVNIKILLRKIVLDGHLTLPARNKLLASMTDNVAELVLKINYQQTQALTIAEAQAPELVTAHDRCMREMEKSGLLNRTVEYLPDSNEIIERQAKNMGLSRPELAVLMSYTKLWLYEQLLKSDLVDDPLLQKDLRTYFPSALQKKYPAEIAHHQLRREIIATSVTNDFVNRVGMSFVFSIMKTMNCSAVDVVKAYLIARDVFDLPTQWHDIESLDNKVPAKAQTRMLLRIKLALSALVKWYMSNETAPEPLTMIIDRYKDRLKSLLATQLSGKSLRDAAQDSLAKELMADGVPSVIAKRAALASTYVALPDIIKLCERTKCAPDVSTQIFFALENRLGLVDVRDRVAMMKGLEKTWQREAISLLQDDLATAHRTLAQKITVSIAKNKKLTVQLALAKWEEDESDKLAAYDSVLKDLRSTSGIDFALLTLTAKRIAQLI